MASSELDASAKGSAPSSPPPVRHASFRRAFNMVPYVVLCNRILSCGSDNTSKYVALLLTVVLRPAPISRFRKNWFAFFYAQNWEGGFR